MDRNVPDFSISSTSTQQLGPNAQESHIPAEEYVGNHDPAVYLESPYYFTENGNEVVYEHSYHEFPQHVLQEEIVEETYEEPASIPSLPTNKSILIKETYPNNTVLLTANTLAATNASFVSRCGRKRRKVENPPEIGGKINRNGSLLNQNLPDMTNMFKVVTESAIVKAELFIKNETEEEGGNEAGGEEKSQKIVENVGEEDEEEELDFVREHTPPPLEKIGVDLGGDFTEAHFDQWPLYSNQAIDFKEACEVLIGVQLIDDEKVCKTIPQQFKHEGTFIIDLRVIGDANMDNNGQWDIPSGKSRFFKENEEGVLIRVDNGRGQLKEWAKEYSYKIQLKKYDNRVTRNADEGRGHFVKKIYTGLKGDQRIGLAIITYHWAGGRPWNFVPPVSTKSLKRTNWEKKSYEKVDLTSMPQMVSAFYEGFNIYSCCVINFDEACGIMLGATPIDANKICPAVPVGYRQNGTFVIDLKRMGHCLLELRRDDNGIWFKPSGFSRFYKFADNGDAIRVDKVGKLPPGQDYDVKISSKRYEHTQVDRKFVKKIYTAKGKNSDTFPGSPDFAVIVYYWKGEPIPFEPTFKQNSVRRDAKEYARFQRLEAVENQFVETTEPVQVVEEVVEEIVEHIPVEQLVCHEQQEMDNPTSSSSKRGRFQSEAVHDLKLNLIRREIENQDRFSAVLDRTEALLARMEQRMGMVMEVYPVEEQVVQEEWHGEEIIQEEEEVIHEY